MPSSPSVPRPVKMSAAAHRSMASDTSAPQGDAGGHEWQPARFFRTRPAEPSDGGGLLDSGPYALLILNEALRVSRTLDALWRNGEGPLIVPPGGVFGAAAALTGAASNLSNGCRWGSQPAVRRGRTTR